MFLLKTPYQVDTKLSLTTFKYMLKQMYLKYYVINMG